jgi:glutamine amidotransferase
VKQLDNARKVARLESWLGGSKLVVFTTLQKMRSQFYIVNERLGHWDNGTWWSNDSYLPPIWKQYPAATWQTVGAENCPTCSSAIDDEGDWYGICQVCGTCLDCAETIEACLCFDPARA